MLSEKIFYRIKFIPEEVYDEDENEKCFLASRQSRRYAVLASGVGEVRKIAIVILFFLYWPTTGRTQTGGWNSPENRATMKGLTGVEVFAAIGPNCEPLSGRQIRADTEVQLRLARIAVLEHVGETLKTGRASLTVVASCYRVQNPDVISFHIVAKLNQIIPWRSSLAVVTTWESAEFIGISNSENIGPRARDSIRDCVTQFINAWLSVNPMK